jgi:predicted dehydrogenase
MKPSNPTQKKPKEGISRRQFVVTSGVAATAFSIVPRHVLGGAGFVPPSEKCTIACIGCGTQALRELPDLLNQPELQFVAVCDPVKDSQDYLDWSRDGLRSSLANALGQPEWRRNRSGIPGGRDVAKEVIETIYARQRGKDQFKGCTTYADFRELLDRESDVNAVWVMTPDHLHAAVAIAAMKKGRHVRMHKPLANRLRESRLVIDTARQTGVATHFQPASEGEHLRPIKTWIDQGAIGTLREIHNWSNRPVWPQYPTVPTDRPPIPPDFDWQLWLGPSQDRPYHPHYTHAVFRGWYEFGGGALADMGHYSLWPVFQAFDLDAPYCVESTPSHACTLDGNVAVRIRNDYSFPAACVIRFRFAAKGNRPALDLFWYDGSIKPTIPEQLESQNMELEPEGMMFVGDKGIILGTFHGENPRLLAGGKVVEAETAPQARSQQSRRSTSWITAFKGGTPTCGDFLLAGPIADAFNLGAVSLRMGGRRLLFDSAAGEITNLPEANRYLTRDYRPGWEL